MKQKIMDFLYKNKIISYKTYIDFVYSQYIQTVHKVIERERKWQEQYR